MTSPEPVTEQRGQKVWGLEITLQVNGRAIEEFRQKYDRITFGMKYVLVLTIDFVFNKYVRVVEYTFRFP